MKGRTIVVTGGAQGIGYTISKAFIQNGDFVAICDLDEQKVKMAAKQLGNAKGYQVDVTKEEEVYAFVENVVYERGKIDVIVNNAGLQHIDKVEDFPIEKWRLLIDVMLTGPFLLTKFAIPHMKKRKYGRIINISSVHGRTASPYKSAYIAAKHGIVGLTKTVAIETANDGITVNAIMPGAVRTKLIENQLSSLAIQDGTTEEEALNNNLLNKQPMKRLLEPEEIAQAAIFLASDGASAITGETLNVSGGW